MLNFPAIPNPSDTYGCLSAMKEILEVFLGLRGVQNSMGEHLDKVILRRDLPVLLSGNITIINSMSSGLTSSVGFGAASEKVISGGAIEMTGSNNFRFHTIDTEGGSSTDDLDTISGGNAGELLLIKPESGDRAVVCKNSASLILGIDFTMNNVADSMLLVGISQGIWYELARHNGGN